MLLVSFILLPMGLAFGIIEERRIILEGNKYIDEIRVYSAESELENMIRTIKPDIRIIGSDWRNKE